MIDELQVKNLALIAQASIEPCKGLTVLTGETGAGKTALLTALKMLMGERGDKTLVRDGADELYVAGRLFSGNEETVAIRRISADGRSKVSLNGEMAGVAELAAAVGPQVDLCSQNEHQQLMKAAQHAEVLDAWIGEAALEAKGAYKAAYAQVQVALQALQAVENAQTAGNARLEEARFIHKRISEVNPLEGEYEELLSELRRVEYAEALANATEGAYLALSGSEGEGAEDLLSRAAQALEAAAAHDEKLARMAETLRNAEAAVQDISMQVRSYRDDLEFDAEEMAAKQDRVAAMQGLMRSFGPRMEDVFARKAEAEELLSLVDDAELCLEEAKRELVQAEERLAAAQGVLHQVRAEAAPHFEALVTAQMQRLEMGSAQLSCVVEELPRERWISTGGSLVEFFFRSGAGTTPRPLAKIASGGEVSRVMLALKVVLGEKDAVETLVFDEIDAGVGGATALAMADVIEDLSKTHQVMVVTHLAQVAAKAERHYLVRKSAGDVPETTITEIAGEARELEIARMLGGSVTDASLAHARELLAR